ncbi:hypothetical protein BBJ29_007835 [Phytophthora kernoviae]|uniref:PH domain-containing protein n=1 Tax=Phytophthora kernoviae TaxID=325452 RepID=A0A3R7H584_9STRA|nr:hypothetical protein BBJ29_007835 [Phytophthora kernoviae]
MQEAAKGPVGTIHSRGLPAPVSATAILVSDKWECSKAGCGHMNSRHAPACNNDGQILRTGVLFKKGSGTGPFGRKNWKPRYFVLTPSRLQYFTFEDGELKGELNLSGCDEGVLEVMPADSMKTGSSASTIWRVAINAPERRLLVAAGTEMEMNDWVDKLVMAFRINSGQPPVQRASMPASTGSLVQGNNVNSNPSIRDFQNFSVPRRGVNQRHSTGGEMQESQHFQAEHLMLHQQQMEEQRREDEELQRQREQEEEQLRQLAQDEEQDRRSVQLDEQRRQSAQDAEMRKQLAAQAQREQEEHAGQEERAEQEEHAQQEEEAHAAALAAAEELQIQEEQEKKAQKEHEMQERKEIEVQQAMELQRAREAEEAARLQMEQEQEDLRNKRLAEELAIQEKLKSQQGEDLLELQRRQKREEHARQRAEREQAVRNSLKQQQDQDDLAFRMTQQMNSHFSVDDESDDSDKEPEGSPPSPTRSSGIHDAETAHTSASASAPRSSLIGDVKREMMQKQQLEHQRRREAALKQEQQERNAEWRQQQVELEQQRTQMEKMDVRESPREVEIAPREIEVVRRAPVKPKPTPAAPMESFEF